MARSGDLLRNLAAILGSGGLLTDAAAGHVYSRDASHLTLGRPLAVALPRTARQVADVVAACARQGVPVVCRGAGTGLSGGAVPPEGALVLSTARMNVLEAVDEAGGRVGCGPGVLNDRVSALAAPWGLHFAPDPSSQSASTIGGNIAENAGGPHCLRHGVTLQHLRGLNWCDARGRLLSAGRGVPGERGFHLTSLLCGSEGTLGVVTAADLNLVPNPPAVATLLAFFPRLDDATGAVVRLLGEGMLPVAVEMVDQAMLQAVEEAFAFGFPSDVEAAMICEFAGLPEEVEEDSGRAGDLLTAAGAREVRRARNEAERLELWKCRKKAFGAVGRLTPAYVTMDVVVPLGRLPRLVRRIREITTEHGVRIATAFHAGDGNLHPGVQYDDRDPDQARRAHAAADAIIGEALHLGGSCTGEHGVGLEKLHAVPWQLDAGFARLQREIKNLFDPAGLFNPGKLLPDSSAAFAALKPLPTDLEFDWGSLTVTAPAATPLAELQARALERGLWVPVGVCGTGPSPGPGAAGTVGELIDHLLPGPGLLAAGSARDFLLELWAATGDGAVFRAGAPVFKNVAGYDLAHALCGAGGVFVRPLAATFQLRPAPEAALLLRLAVDHAAPGFPAGLARLTRFLARRSGCTAGSNLLTDPGTGQLTLVAAGRTRSWDLPGLQDEVVAIWPELVPLFRGQVAFAAAAGLVEQLPSWARSSTTWTSLAARPGQALSPPSAPRLLWQSLPRLWWTPDPWPGAAGWHTDAFLAEGRRGELPPPGAAAPLDLLRGLKRVFDPEGVFGGPSWLTGDGHEA